MIRSAILLLLLPLGAIRAAIGPDDPKFEALARAGISHVYNLEFEAANKDFDELLRLEPRHPAGHFFLAMVDWWRILIDLDDESRDDLFFAELDTVIDLCDSMLDRNDQDVSAIFFKGGALGFQGRLRFHRNDYLAAANAGRKALPLVQKAISLDPHNYDLFLGTGIYDYFAEVVPNEYPFAKPLLLFIPPGDKKRGIEELTVASERGTYASTESAYFLMQIYFFYERDYAKALAIARKLTKEYPNNMLFLRYLGRAYAAMSNWTMSQTVFADISGRCRRHLRGFTEPIEREAEYYLGVAEMSMGKLDEALGHFYRCDEISRGLDTKEPSGFMVTANLKIGNVYDLQGKRDLAVMQYHKVLEMRDYKDALPLAREYLRIPYSR